MVAQPAADIFTSLRPPTAQQIANADPERLAGLDVIVGQEVGIGNNEHTRSRRGVVSLFERMRNSAKHSPKLRFELRQTRRQGRLAGALSGMPGRWTNASFRFFRRQFRHAATRFAFNIRTQLSSRT